MSRSNRKSTTSTASTRNTSQPTSRSTTSTPTPVREDVVRAKREISRYSFEYKRDHVSRKAGASYFYVESHDGSEGLEMTLQEAQSLYNFLGKALAR